MTKIKKGPEMPGDCTPLNPGEQSSEQTTVEISKDARQWAMFCHLGGLAGIAIPVVGNIVAPLIIWQIKKDDFPFVEGSNFSAKLHLSGLRRYHYSLPRQAKRPSVS